METTYLLITILSLIGTILAWLSKLRWSKEYADAKNETIKAKDAEIAAIVAQLLAKEEMIKIKNSQIENLNSLNPMRLREYFESVKQTLIEENEKMEAQIIKLKARLKDTEEKINVNKEGNAFIQERQSLKETIISLEDTKQSLKKGWSFFSE